MAKSESVFLTLLVYLREGKESTFRDYEDQVLPMMRKYGGKLEYRLKTRKSDDVAMDEPDEIHLVSFPSHDSYERYRQDPGRSELSSLFTDSVARAQLYEGQQVH